MALFGLNWEESKWPGHFSSTFLNFFASKIGVKLPPKKKVPWHQRWPALARGSNCHFCQKNAFFGQKKAFFQKVHFIQKCSVTQNTVFQYVKNNFLLSQKKLVFFTILNLHIRSPPEEPHLAWVDVIFLGDFSCLSWASISLVINFPNRASWQKLWPKC